MKTVNIKGKEYVLVKDRILALSGAQVPYSITTEVIATPADIPNTWVVKATLNLNGSGEYTGHAQEVIGDGYINKTSALENAETSAVGRACAMAGIGVIDSIASVDEINKAQNRSRTPQELHRDALKAIESATTTDRITDVETGLEKILDMRKPENKKIVAEVKEAGQKKHEQLKANGEQPFE